MGLTGVALGLVDSDLLLFLVWAGDFWVFNLRGCLTVWFRNLGFEWLCRVDIIYVRGLVLRVFGTCCCRWFCFLGVWEWCCWVLSGDAFWVWLEI